MAFVFLAAACILVVAFGVARLVLRHARRLGLIQAPNQRSSHVQPTPSGGGLGIVAGGSIGTVLMLWQLPQPALVVLVGGLLIAAIGFQDDRHPLPARFRLAAQLALLAAAVLTVAPPEALTAALGLPLWLFLPLAVLGGVYWINLFNFMDGIDGIAASQAIFMFGAAAALVDANAGTDAPLVAWLSWLAAATAGFLLLNWPPARIFMGDAGSTYLGFVIAMLALLSIAAGMLSVWQWAILAGSFVTDATVTLLHRLLRRERIFEAHRSHAYQILSRRWHSHRRVTVAFIVVNLLFLLPLAAFAGPGRPLAPLLAVIAYLPLALAAVVAGAGSPERPAARTAT